MARLRTVAVLLAGVLAVLAGGAQGCGKSSSKGCTTFCGGVCTDQVNYQTDPNNCGGCGVQCGAGATCSGGTCQCAEVGRSLCPSLSPRCRDLQTDAGACGTCGTSCEAAFKPGASCQGGVCGCYGAKPDECAASCTNTQSDPANCGSGTAGCGHACLLSGEVCAGGVCACPAALPTQCPAGAPTACVNTTNDPANCGGCGIVCPLLDEACVTAGATSTCQCPSSLPDQCPAAGALPARCTNKGSSVQDCGACANACTASGQTCSGGRCTCPGGQDVCFAVCSAKPAGSSCSATTHVWECPSGPTPGCGGQCCAGGQTCCQNGSACQTAHSNGLGQSYFDCNAPYAANQTTLAAAQAAAAAWSASGTTFDGTTACGTSCFGLQTATQCAVWCYGQSPWAGLVALDASSQTCTCPVAGVSPTWN